MEIRTMCWENENKEINPRIYFNKNGFVLTDKKKLR